MLISREADYALRILRVLSDGARHNTKMMCKTEEIPQSFAYKIIRKLATAQMVRSIRGIDGGCELMVNLEELSVYDLLAALGDTFFINACTVPGFQCEWEKIHPEQCKVHQKLMMMQASLDQLLRSWSLQSLLI